MKKPKAITNTMFLSKDEESMSIQGRDIDVLLCRLCGNPLNSDDRCNICESRPKYKHKNETKKKSLTYSLIDALARAMAGKFEE